jgi:hypothetical protein
LAAGDNTLRGAVLSAAWLSVLSLSADCMALSCRKTLKMAGE